MERTVETLFYTYSQNNSGGSFRISDEEGICEYVIIEALNSAHADTRAESIGLYFDGCDEGIDCPCCGDRWYEQASYEKGYEVPSIYGRPADQEIKSWYRNRCFVHYLDNTIKEIKFKDD